MGETRTNLMERKEQYRLKSRKTEVMHNNKYSWSVKNKKRYDKVNMRWELGYYWHENGCP